MADDERRRIEEAKKAKQAEMDRKRAEVRARMEEASKAKKAKKGFMTPERKKKLRLLLRKKAAEELKKEQERKAAERRKCIEERCGTMCDLDNSSEDKLKKICQDYHKRINLLEEKKYDLEFIVKRKDMEIADLNVQVNDLRGKFIKPALKKVSKYENKFAKLQKKAAEFNFRNQLKQVKKKEFSLEDEDKEKKGIVDFKKDEKKDDDDEEDEDEYSEATEDQASGDLLTEASSIPAEEAAPEVEELPPPEPEVPPPPPTPPKTEEDLWLYLKDAITSANPLSIEELKERLLDTAAHIPPSYMEPVVVASIKRSQSMELSNIESLPGDDAPKEGEAPAGEVKEGEPKPEGEEAKPAEGEAAAAPPAEGEVKPPEGEAKPAEGEAKPAEGAAPAEGTAPAEGAPPAEGAAPPAEGTATEGEAAAAPPAEGEAKPADAAAVPADAPPSEPAPVVDPAPVPVEGESPHERLVFSLPKKPSTLPKKLTKQKTNKNKGYQLDIASPSRSAPLNIEHNITDKTKTDSSPLGKRAYEESSTKQATKELKEFISTEKKQLKSLPKGQVKDQNKVYERGYECEDDIKLEETLEIVRKIEQSDDFTHKSFLQFDCNNNPLDIEFDDGLMKNVERLECSSSSTQGFIEHERNIVDYMAFSSQDSFDNGILELNHQNELETRRNHLTRRDTVPLADSFMMNNSETNDDYDNETPDCALDIKQSLNVKENDDVHNRQLSDNGSETDEDSELPRTTYRRNCKLDESKTSEIDNLTDKNQGIDEEMFDLGGHRSKELIKTRDKLHKFLTSSDSINLVDSVMMKYLAGEEWDYSHIADDVKVSEALVKLASIDQIDPNDENVSEECTSISKKDKLVRRLSALKSTESVNLADSILMEQLSRDYDDRSKQESLSKTLSALKSVGETVDLEDSILMKYLSGEDESKNDTFSKTLKAFKSAQTIDLADSILAEYFSESNIEESKKEKLSKTLKLLKAVESINLADTIMMDYLSEEESDHYKKDKLSTKLEMLKSAKSVSLADTVLMKYLLGDEINHFKKEELAKKLAGLHSTESINLADSIVKGFLSEEVAHKSKALADLKSSESDETVFKKLMCEDNQEKKERLSKILAALKSDGSVHLAGSILMELLSEVDSDNTKKAILSKALKSLKSASVNLARSISMELLSDVDSGNAKKEQLSKPIKTMKSAESVNLADSLLIDLLSEDNTKKDNETYVSTVFKSAESANLTESIFEELLSDGDIDQPKKDNITKALNALKSAESANLAYSILTELLSEDDFDQSIKDKVSKVIGALKIPKQVNLTDKISDALSNITGSPDNEALERSETSSNSNENDDLAETCSIDTVVDSESNRSFDFDEENDDNKMGISDKSLQNSTKSSNEFEPSIDEAITDDNSEQSNHKHQPDSSGIEDTFHDDFQSDISEGSGNSDDKLGRINRAGFYSDEERLSINEEYFNDKVIDSSQSKSIENSVTFADDVIKNERENSVNVKRRFSLAPEDSVNTIALLLCLWSTYNDWSFSLQF